MTNEIDMSGRMYKRFKCCLRCIHYKPDALCRKPKETTAGELFTFGDCRRHAPNVTVNKHGVAKTTWPFVRSFDFCGDFELDEEEVEGVQYALDSTSYWAYHEFKKRKLAESND